MKEWKKHRYSEPVTRLKEWKPWFAWYPVQTVSDRWVWWKTIYRKIGNDYVDYDNWRWYWYGDEFDILKESR
jgi:hypothetical protein